MLLLDCPLPLLDAALLLDCPLPLLDAALLLLDAVLLLDCPLPFDWLLDDELRVVPLLLVVDAPEVAAEELLLVVPVVPTAPVEGLVFPVVLVTIELP